MVVPTVSGWDRPCRDGHCLPFPDGIDPVGTGIARPNNFARVCAIRKKTADDRWSSLQFPDGIDPVGTGIARPNNFARASAIRKKTADDRWSSLQFPDGIDPVGTGIARPNNFARASAIRKNGGRPMVVPTVSGWDRPCRDGHCPSEQQKELPSGSSFAFWITRRRFRSRRSSLFRSPSTPCAFPRSRTACRACRPERARILPCPPPR